jgi:thiol-disulfide isomerase/thioredoxin
MIGTRRPGFLSRRIFMKSDRFVYGAVVALCAAWFVIDIHAGDKVGPPPVKPLSTFLKVEGPMPTLDGAVEWLNSKPLTSTQLRGKVVLVDFWTYSCINWLRTLPYVRAWAEKYKDQGLVVVGVHTPEFGFEKNLTNVREATAQLKVGFPVAVDSAQTIWRAFDNRYWPAVYVIDARGMVRHYQFGEGDYEGLERVIQQLLVEAGAKDVDRGLVRVEATGNQVDADWTNLRSPETYIGSDRTENFASPGGMATGRQHLYSAPGRLRLNSWALIGEWSAGREAATLVKANGRIAYRFHARDLHLVMGPAARGKPVPFRVRIDGQPPGAAHGTDVDAEGRGVLVETRLYQLIRQPKPVMERLFEIEFLEPGVEAYSFTFG